MNAGTLRRSLIKRGIPDHTHHQVIDYVIHGRAVGGFLQAVLENNLVEAFGRADGANIRSMYLYAMMLHNDLPSDCWGSKEIRQAWMKVGGLAGKHPQLVG